MIVLDSGDKLRADASVANKVDYTTYGLVNDSVAQLSDGQFAAAEADIFTAANNGDIVSTIILVNTHTSAITCNLYMKPSGGTSRCIISKDTVLGAGFVLTYDGIRLLITDEYGNIISYQEGDVVATPMGYTYLMKQSDNTLSIPLIDSDRHPQIDIAGALPAGSAKIGSMDVNKLGGTWTCIPVNISTATTTELKAASAGHAFTVIAISLTIAAENNLTWKSATNTLSGPMDFGAANESHDLQINLWPCGLKCNAGEALNLTTTTTGQVSGFITVLDEG